MRLLILLLFLSCQKTINSNLVENKKNPDIELLTEDISGDIDLFVTFYWPKKIKDGDQTLVKNIIANSRDITDIKDQYYDSKMKLLCPYRERGCDCDSYDGFCDNECEELNDKLAQIEFTIISMSKKIGAIQDSVKDLEGSWLKTHLDYFYLTPDKPYIDLGKNFFSISILEDIKIGYNTEDSSIFDMSFDGRILRFKIKEKKLSQNGEVQETPLITHAKLAIHSKKNLYQAMGELETYQADELVRRGIMFFEIPKKGWADCQ